jgi:hypothetical protein
VAGVMRNKVTVFACLWCCAAVGVFAAQPDLRSYQISLPHHVLRVTLAEKMAREMPPWKQPVTRFDASDPYYERDGMRELATATFPYKGPFWVGTIGSLKFHFMVQRRLPEYVGEITTIEGLDRYLRWWNPKIDNDADNCVFSRSTLNGMPTVRREWNSLGNANISEPEYLEIFSLPLDEGMFLDVGLNIREWVGGRRDKWMKKAEEMSEAIKTTITLEPKKG